MRCIQKPGSRTPSKDMSQLISAYSVSEISTSSSCRRRGASRLQVSLQAAASNEVSKLRRDVRPLDSGTLGVEPAPPMGLPASRTSSACGLVSQVTEHMFAPSFGTRQCRESHSSLEELVGQTWSLKMQDRHGRHHPPPHELFPSLCAWQSSLDTCVSTSLKALWLQVNERHEMRRSLRTFLQIAYVNSLHLKDYGPDGKSERASVS